MQLTPLAHFTSVFGGSLKPAVAAFVAGTAGVTAFASPLAPADRAGLNERPAAQFGVVALRAEARPMVVAPARPAETREVAVRQYPIAPVPQHEPAELVSAVGPRDFAEVASFRLAPAAAPVQPVVSAPPVQASMPAAELKAMMAQVVASRGEGEALAYSSVQRETQLGDAGDAEPAIAKAAKAGSAMDFEVAALVNGKPAGRVPLKIVDGDTISVKLADVLAALEPMMDSSAYEALSTSTAAGEYVSFTTLRAHGIAVRFDADDRLMLGTS